MNLKRYFAIFIFFFSLDQVSKWLIRSYYHLGESKEILGNFLRFTRINNPGAVFGINIGSGSFNRLFFLILTFAAILIIVYLFIISKEILPRIAFTLIFSGAMGNLVDRLAFGKVTDFLDVDFFDFIIRRWYTFNVADSCIVVGVTVLLIYYIFFEKENITHENGVQKET